MEAKLLRNIEGWRGDAALYQLTPPYEHEGSKVEFVIVSAASVPFTGVETYIFPAKEDGETESFGELPGSYRGGWDHGEALRGLGYELRE